jgi:hypothetical protein
MISGTKSGISILVGKVHTCFGRIVQKFDIPILFICRTQFFCQAEQVLKRPFSEHYDNYCVTFLRVFRVSDFHAQRSKKEYYIVN